MRSRPEDPDLRARLVAAAIRLLADGGPEALQARPLVAEAGTSTMAVYTRFGGMPGVVEAVAEEGFRLLAARLDAVPETADPVADIFGLAMGYRQAALDNPHLYGVMFGLTAPGGRRVPTVQVTAETPQLGQRAFERLTGAVRRAYDAGRFHVGEPSSAAAQLWSGLHGFITLELAGYFGAEDDSLAQVLAPLGANLAVGLGDDLESAAASSLAGAGGWLRENR
ncbi:WHG domain-containing protein [Longispora urticae]